MADRNDARPEFNPKHRIVGAIVIVAFAVIVLPLVLRGREPPAALRDANETAAVRGVITDTRVVVTPVAPEEARAKSVPEAAPPTEMKTAIVESAPKPEPKPAPTAEKPAAKKISAPAPAPEKTAKAAQKEKLARGWMVQVGTFSNIENAARLRDKLASHGHAVHDETVTLHGKRVMRLRVGPYRDKTEAMKAIAQIHKLTGVQGVALAYP
jgi:DedD protein